MCKFILAPPSLYPGIPWKVQKALVFENLQRCDNINNDIVRIIIFSEKVMFKVWHKACQCNGMTPAYLQRVIVNPVFSSV